MSIILYIGDSDVNKKYFMLIPFIITTLVTEETSLCQLNPCFNADTSFVLLDVTCSPRGLAVHMQMFAT